MPTSPSPYPHLAEHFPVEGAATDGQMSRSISKRAELELSRFTADYSGTQQRYASLPDPSPRNDGVDALTGASYLGADGGAVVGVLFSSTSREKGYRPSRGTQSLYRGNKKTRDRDVHLDTYNLHSDDCVNEIIKSDKQRCTVCSSTRDLTHRKDCEHFLCGSCRSIGLYKGQCSVCKRSKVGQSRSAVSTEISDREHRSRSRSKKLTPDIKPLHGHSNYR